jgi:hypothetical protein
VWKGTWGLDNRKQTAQKHSEKKRKLLQNKKEKQRERYKTNNKPHRKTVNKQNVAVQPKEKGIQKENKQQK